MAKGTYRGGTRSALPNTARLGQRQGTPVSPSRALRSARVTAVCRCNRAAMSKLDRWFKPADRSFALVEHFTFCIRARGDFERVFEQSLASLRKLFTLFQYCGDVDIDIVAQIRRSIQIARYLYGRRHHVADRVANARSKKDELAAAGRQARHRLD